MVDPVGFGWIYFDLVSMQVAGVKSLSEARKWSVILENPLKNAWWFPARIKGKKLPFMVHELD